MKIIQIQPDQEGMIYQNNVVKFLGARLIKDVPSVWCAVDPMGKEGARLTIVVKRTGDSIEVDLLQVYVTTLANDKEVFHLFEQVSKFANAGQMPPLNLPKP